MRLWDFKLSQYPSLHLNRGVLEINFARPQTFLFPLFIAKRGLGGVIRIYNRTDMKERRRILRRNQTSEEDRLWQVLRNHQFFGVKFYRQFSIGFYIADFYAPSHKLVIEIDGKHHEPVEGKTYDDIRTEMINSLDINVLRFRNEDIRMDIDSVLQKLAVVMGFM